MSPHQSDDAPRPFPILLVLGLSLVLLAWGAFVQVVVAVACSENVHPGTTRADVCGLFGGDTSRAAIALGPPALLLVATASTQRPRALAMIAFAVMALNGLILAVVAIWA